MSTSNDHLLEVLSNPNLLNSLVSSIDEKINHYQKSLDTLVELRSRLPQATESASPNATANNRFISPNSISNREAIVQALSPKKRLSYSHLYEAVIASGHQISKNAMSVCLYKLVRNKVLKLNSKTRKYSLT